MKKLAMLVPMSAALALAACGGTTEADTAAVDNVATDNMAMGEADLGATNMAAPADVPTDPQQFANAAAASDQYEIQSSQMAAEKAARADVKEFAAMLVTEHQTSTANLKTAAGQVSPAITPAPELTAEQQANLDALRAAANGEAFDRLYLQQQVPAHEKALAMLQGYAQSGQAQPLKDFAGQTAPVVEKHLERARQLQQQ